MLTGPDKLLLQSTQEDAPSLALEHPRFAFTPLSLANCRPIGNRKYRVLKLAGSIDITL